VCSIGQFWTNIYIVYDMAEIRYISTQQKGECLTFKNLYIIEQTKDLQPFYAVGHILFSKNLANGIHRINMYFIQKN